MGRGSAEILLQAVEYQAVLDLLRLPHVGVEHPVDFAHVGQQHEQLENVPVDFELYPGEIVDNVAITIGDCSRSANPSVDRIESDRRMLFPQPLDMLKDSLRRDMICHHIHHGPIRADVVAVRADQSDPLRRGTGGPR
ncbi:hypothetical protein GCM10027568_28030 [Humibacter soli]